MTKTTTTTMSTKNVIATTTTSSSSTSNNNNNNKTKEMKFLRIHYTILKGLYTTIKDVDHQHDDSNSSMIHKNYSSNCCIHNEDWITIQMFLQERYSIIQEQLIQQNYKNLYNESIQYCNTTTTTNNNNNNNTNNEHPFAIISNIIIRQQQQQQSNGNKNNNNSDSHSINNNNNNNDNNIETFTIRLQHLVQLIMTKIIPNLQNQYTIHEQTTIHTNLQSLLVVQQKQEEEELDCQRSQSIEIQYMIQLWSLLLHDIQIVLGGI